MSDTGVRSGHQHHQVSWRAGSPPTTSNGGYRHASRDEDGAHDGHESDEESHALLRSDSRKRGFTLPAPTVAPRLRAQWSGGEAVKAVLLLAVGLALGVCLVPLTRLHVPLASTAAVAGTSPEWPRVLVLMADNRALQREAELETLNEVTAAALVNFAYTRIHPSTAFRYIHYAAVDQSAVVTGRASNSSKHSAACVCGPLQQHRAAPWCKVQAMYHALVTEPNFDVVFFIDSDAVISGYLTPLPHLLHSADTVPGYCNTHDFLSESAACSALFFHDAPWELLLPNTGAVLLRRSNHSLALLRAWWGFDHASRNFRHGYEQDTLHIFMYTSDAQRAQPAKQMHVLDRPLHEVMGVVQEPSMKHVSELQLIHHYTSVDKPLRLPYFTRTLRRILHDPALQHLQLNFSTLMRDVHQHVRELDLNIDPTPPGDAPHDAAGHPVDTAFWVERWATRLRPET